MKPEEVLKEAARLIRRDGWTRYVDHRRGRRCAFAAVVDAAHELGANFSPAINLLSTRVINEGFFSITSWNDSRGPKGRPQVLRMLEK